MEMNGEPEKTDMKETESREKKEKAWEPVKPKVASVVKSTAPPPAPSIPPAPPPVRPPSIRLEVFCRLTGIKWDRLAAFKYYARKRKLGPLPVKEWWAELKKFQKRPVG